VISKPKGNRTQLLGYYDPSAVKQLRLLSKQTRVPQSVYLREALDDLLRKYLVVAGKPKLERYSKAFVISIPPIRRRGSPG
jgi:hypothetical protein